MSEDTQRSFYLLSERAIERLVRLAEIVPLGGKHAILRAHRWDGKFKFGDHEFEVKIRGMDHIVTCEGSSLKQVYRKIKESQNAVNSSFEVRAIKKPVLPKSIINTIQTVVFDYYEAIEEFGSTKGFGNIGIILTGPPGTGKSETMRWVSEVAREEYNRGCFQLSLSSLTKMLAEGVPLNTNEGLIFIDDIDANILRSRKTVSNPLVSQFLTCLDGLDKREGRVIIVSTNETLDDVDPALTRPGRFEQIIRFDYPTPDLIEQFCIDRELEISPRLFSNWSFARIDMFISRFKVAEFRYDVSIGAFYEQFISTHGETDPTVEACQVGSHYD